MKHIYNVILKSICIVLVFTLVGCSNGKEDDGLPSVINIGTQELPNEEMVARINNYFEEEFGIPVNFMEFQAGDIRIAMVSGDIDFAMLGSTNAILGVCNKMDVSLIWIHEIVGTSEQLIVQKDRNLNEIKDLKGKRLAAPLATTAHYSLVETLKANGINEDEVTIYDMQMPEIYAAFLSGEIDGAYVWEPTVSKMKEIGKTLMTSEELADQGIVTANVEIVRNEFMEKYPELVEDYIRVVNESEIQMEEDPQGVIPSLAKYLSLSEEDVKTIMDGSIRLNAKQMIEDQYLGTTTHKGKFLDSIIRTAYFLDDQRSLVETPDEKVLEEFVHPEFAEKIAKEMD